MDSKEKIVTERRRGDRSRLADSSFLVGMVVLSALPYVFGLGFYSDDWAYQPVLVRASHFGIGAMFRELARADQGFLTRPVQLAYLVLGFRIFGQNATAYHLFDCALLGLMTAVVYLAARELGVERLLAVSVALVFGMLPHYATDRFWIASQQATLSMGLAALGVYALLRAARAEARRILWKVVGAGALVLSILAYEVVVGLIIASLAWMGWRYYKGESNSPRSGRALWGLAATGALLLIVGVIKFRVQTRIVLPRHPAHFLMRLGGVSGHAMLQALRFNFWTYGLNAPVVLMRLFRHSALSKAALVCAIGIALGVSAYLWRNAGSMAKVTTRGSFWLLVVSVLLFWLGFAMFFPYGVADFSTPGVDNRVAIASALGASCAMVALVGLLASLVKTETSRRAVYCTGIGLVCGMECLIVNGLGWFWVDAASQQTAILKNLVADVRSLPEGSVLLLDGFCRYSGPAVVFETDWDTTGAIQLALRDASVKGDVVSPGLTLEDSAVETRAYGGVEGTYPYGDHLFLYNVRLHSVTSLTSRKASEAYFGAVNPTRNSGCPVAQEGSGAKFF